MKLRRNFTLIELLIVVAIIAILAAIAVPSFINAQTRAKVSRTLADMRAVTLAIESYFIDHNAYPGSVDVNLSLTINLTPDHLVTPAINRLVSITTPIAYITSAFPDVFNSTSQAEAEGLSVRDERVLQYWSHDFLTDIIEVDGKLIDLKYRTQAIFREFPRIVQRNQECPYVGGCNHGQGDRVSHPVSFESVRDPLWALTSFGPDQDLDIFDPCIHPDWHCEDKWWHVVQAYDPTNGTVSDGDIFRFRE